MKSLKLVITTIALAILCDSCVSAYVHNTFKAPIYDTVYAKDISFDAGLHHVGAAASVAATTNMHFLTSGHMSSFKGNLGGYGELGMGYHDKLSPKFYVGAYYTLGIGSNKGEWNDPIDLFGSVQKLSCSYMKHSFNAYIKIKGKHFRPYIGLRTSFVNFHAYQKNNYGLLQDFEQWTHEPVLGFEIVPRKNFYFFCQNLVMLYRPSVKAYVHYYTYDAPQYKVYTMRFGVGWTLR